MFGNKRIAVDEYDRLCDALIKHHDQIKELKEEMGLLLTHLNLRYVPETKEPAKLEDKAIYRLPENFGEMNFVFDAQSYTNKKNAKLKKKRGRPRKK